MELQFMYGNYIYNSSQKPKDHDHTFLNALIV